LISITRYYPIKGAITYKAHERAAPGAKPLDLCLRLVVSEEAGFAGTAAAFVLWGFRAKKSVDRETLRGYNEHQRTNRPAGLKSPAPTPRN
jgi:hypothetical protein